MDNSDKKKHCGAAIAYLVTLALGGTYYAFVAVNHISAHPHQMLDYVLAVPFAYITLGNCCGIFTLCLWRFAEGLYTAFKNWIIPRDDKKIAPELRNCQS